MGKIFILFFVTLSFFAFPGEAYEEPSLKRSHRERAPKVSLLDVFVSEDNLESFTKQPRRTWTSKEDELTKKYVLKYGPKKWSLIAKELNNIFHEEGFGRTGKQCRERWFNHLSPTINKGPWSLIEDETIIKFHKELGNKWRIIAKHLTGRADNAVKNRWHSLLKYKQSSEVVTSINSSEALKNESIDKLPDHSHISYKTPGGDLLLKPGYVPLSENLSELEELEQEVENLDSISPNVPYKLIDEQGLENSDYRAKGLFELLLDEPIEQISPYETNNFASKRMTEDDLNKVDYPTKALPDKRKIFLDSLTINHYQPIALNKKSDLFDFIRYSLISFVYDFKTQIKNPEEMNSFSEEIKRFIDITKPLLDTKSKQYKTKNFEIDCLQSLDNYLRSFFNTTLDLNYDILNSLFNALSLALKRDITFYFMDSQYVSRYKFGENFIINVTKKRWEHYGEAL